MKTILLATALALDAFAVSICIGLGLKKINAGHVFRVSFHFGFFQFMMPILGYFGISFFKGYIEKFDHWVAFFLLVFIGVKMLFESRESPEMKTKNDPTRKMSLVMLSVATSIDALAVGISIALLGESIWPLAISTGIITSSLSLIGIKGGYKTGKKFGRYMEIIGGIILIFIGFKILFEHLMA